MKKNILAVGPYVGSFEQEILTFRPYMRWVELNVDHTNVLYSSHFNRRFLYSHVKNSQFIPVYKQLSRQELNQHGYFHKDITQRDFTGLIRIFKDKIVEKANCIKKDVDHHSLPYVKYISPISIYQKVFEPFDVPISERKGNIVYIPDISMPEDDALRIYEYLNNRYTISVVGDMKCHLPDVNEVLKCVDYYQNGYKKIITAITNAKAVITPCSHWAVIANLQKVPVISWADNVGQFREGGVYHFDNKKSKSIYKNSDANTDQLLRQIDLFLQEYC